MTNQEQTIEVGLSIVSFEIPCFNNDMLTCPKCDMTCPKCNAERNSAIKSKIRMLIAGLGIDCDAPLVPGRVTLLASEQTTLEDRVAAIEETLTPLTDLVNQLAELAKVQAETMVILASRQLVVK